MLGAHNGGNRWCPEMAGTSRARRPHKSFAPTLCRKSQPDRTHTLHRFLELP